MAIFLNKHYHKYWKMSIVKPKKAYFLYACIRKNTLMPPWWYSCTTYYILYHNIGILSNLIGGREQIWTADTDVADPLLKPLGYTSILFFDKIINGASHTNPPWTPIIIQPSSVSPERERPSFLLHRLNLEWDWYPQISREFRICFLF